MRKRIWKWLCGLRLPLVTINHRLYSDNAFFVHPFLNGKPVAGRDEWPYAILGVCGFGCILFYDKDDNGHMSPDRIVRRWGRVEARLN